MPRKKKEEGVLMTFIIKFGISILNIIYCLFKLLPVKQRVVMLSRQSNHIPFEFEMLKNELKKENPKVEVKFLCKSLGSTLDAGKVSTIICNLSYCLHMFVQMFYLATSKVALTDGYCITICVLKHKKSLKVIQMWHSMGTMKLFGWTALDSEEGSNSKIAKAMHMHENYDYFFASSSAYQKDLANGFRCPLEKARIFPLPRYDLLKDKEYQKNKKIEIYKMYPELADVKVILYCPTFRKDETDLGKALEKLENVVPEGSKLVIKLHPLSKLKVKTANAICDDKFSTLEMLFVADYVISDYSCIVYEAAVMGIPLCFYNFDFDLYIGKRGFAIDMNELPGIISKDASKIMEAISKDAFDKKELKEFADKYVVPTPHATKDIVDFILEIMK